jgi:hypothetical protein
MRYAFCNAFGILTGDDDTDAATVDSDPPAVTFDAPRRKVQAPAEEPLERTLERSVDAAAAARRTQEAEDEVPQDALSKPRIARLYALVHAAIAAADIPDDEHETMFNRAQEYLRSWVATTTGRHRLAHCSYKHYQDLCEQIPAAVEAALRGEARPQPRLLRRRSYAAPRRPLH